MIDTSIVLTLLSASTLPVLALLGILLRKNLFQGKLKIIALSVGFLLLTYTIFRTFLEHGEDLGVSDIFVGTITAIITFFILSRFNHNHTHTKEEDGAKGVVISEAFHSLIDGAVIGTTYLVSPILGGAATLGIVIHELPKIIGTLAIFRGLGLSMRQTIFYAMWAQIGSPVAAVLVFMLGERFNAEQFHALEIASVSSLGAIVLWIIWFEIKHHRNHTQHNH